jgi:hypothetical protein
MFPEKLTACQSRRGSENGWRQSAISWLVWLTGTEPSLCLVRVSARVSPVWNEGSNSQEQQQTFPAVLMLLTYTQNVGQKIRGVGFHFLMDLRVQGHAASIFRTDYVTNHIQNCGYRLCRLFRRDMLLPSSGLNISRITYKTVGSGCVDCLGWTCCFHLKDWLYHESHTKLWVQAV